VPIHIEGSKVHLKLGCAYHRQQCADSVATAGTVAARCWPMLPRRLPVQWPRTRTNPSAYGGAVTYAPHLKECIPNDRVSGLLRTRKTNFQLFWRCGPQLHNAHTAIGVWPYN
jgi:hypothetical protein